VEVSPLYPPERVDAMAGKYTREQISDLVVRLLRELHFRQDITEDSHYGEDILADAGVKKLTYYAVVMRVQQLGGVLIDFNAADCDNAESVRDIVEAV
jgi:hypothetical protein